MSFLLDEGKTWIQRDFGLDRRLIKALSKVGFTYPTLIQAKCIPIAMEGKDLLVRARTGSGKTIAFSLPLLHKVLVDKEADGLQSLSCIRGLVLVPTKELCKQIESELNKLIYYCRDVISLYAIHNEDSSSNQQFRLQKKPDIIISTPAKIVQACRSGYLDLSTVKTLVIDEADLVLSFGYAEDVNYITTMLPKIFQGLLTSATLSPELDKFKRIVLHNPAVLKLEEEGGVMGHLLQFYLRSSDNDKFLILYVFIKLGLLQGKGLIFVNDVNRCYKLKLFLQQFFISAAVLNSEVPANSRSHILEEYNRGVFDYLIATDASIDGGNDDLGDDDEEGDDDDNDSEQDAEDDNDDADEIDDEYTEDDSDEDDQDAESEEEQPVPKKKSKSAEKRISELSAAVNAASELENSDSKRKKRGADPAPAVDEDYGVSRGIDFQGVDFVVNFDFPATAAAYTHRIGRTARGGATGTALSFVTIMPSVSHATNAKESAVAERDAAVLQQVQSQQPWLGSGRPESGDNALASVQDSIDAGADVMDESKMQPAPLQFNMKELDTFRYRVEDTLRGVTGAAVKEYRAAEIKREILNSAKLKTFFAENPTDLKVLRHDKAIAHPIRQKNHLKHVPSYLIPVSMRTVSEQAGGGSRSRKRGRAGPSSSSRRGGGGMSAERRIAKSKKRDPLLGAM